MNLEQLRQFLQDLPPGPISETEPLVEVLAPCWYEFAGSRDQGMESSKLSRMEKPSWDSPHLTFEIERHGSLVNGGSRAEVQRWALDLDTMTAHCAKVGHRQIRPMQPKLDVRPFANEIVELILARREDVRLKWKGDRIVQVLIGKIFPKSSGPRRTVEDRRKSFRTALGKLLERHGWRTDGPSVYKKVS